MHNVFSRMLGYQCKGDLKYKIQPLLNVFLLVFDGVGKWNKLWWWKWTWHLESSDFLLVNFCQFHYVKKTSCEEAYPKLMMVILPSD